MSTYEIIIKDGTASGGGGYENTLPDEAENANNKTATDKDSLKMFAKKGAAVGLAISLFKWQASLVGRNTGNSDIQDKIDASITLATQGIGVIGAFAVGGPVAGAIALASVGISYARQAEANNYSKSWENIALGVSRLRAGPSFNRSR